MSEYYEYRVDSKSGNCVAIMAPRSTAAEALRQNLQGAGFECELSGTMLTLKSEVSIQDLVAVANPDTVRTTIMSTPTITKPPTDFNPDQS